MRNTAWRLALALLVPAGVAATLLAQETSPAASIGDTEAGQEAPAQFEATVEQVVVDLVVIDKDGNPVAGLGPDDMFVTEDGVPQTVVSFEAVALPDEPAPQASPPSPAISTNTEPTALRGRTFVIVLDDMHLTPQRERDAKAAVASFLTNGVREGDYVTLVSGSGEAWWTARMEAGRDRLIDLLDRIVARRVFDLSLERMTDWEAMRIHVYHDEQVARRVTQRYEDLGVTTMIESDRDNPLTGTTLDPYVTARAREVYFETRTRAQVTMGTLVRVLNGLGGVKGRKSVILVSEGFVYDPNLNDFRKVDMASRRANAAIYFVNARGLQGMPPEFSAQFGPPQPDQDIGFNITSMGFQDDGSEEIAEDSGGFTVKNTNDLDGGIERIARETRIYYLLGYNSSNLSRDGKFREIEVKLRNGRGLKVRARKGYYAPTGDGTVESGVPEGVDPVFQAALDSPWADDGIPLRMTDYVRTEKMAGKADVVLVTEVDVDGLEFEEKDGRAVAEIEFLLVVAHRETGEFFRYDQTVTMRLLPATREQLLRSWYPIVREFELAPGDHQARMVVRQKGTGVLGSVIHDFVVPPVDEFRVSTPVVTDIWRPNPTGAGVEPQLLARREFLPGAQLVCQIEVYGASKGDDGLPRVTQGYEILHSDGTVFKRLAPSVINPTSLGALARVFIVSLDYAQPGEYDMVITVRDELAEKTRELHEPFTVGVPPEESAPEPSRGR